MRELTLAGILMYKDMELAKFDIRNGQTEKFVVLAEDKRYFPFEMLKYQNGSTLSNALLARLVPETRQGLMEALAEVGIYEYDPSAIIRFQNGSSAEDCHWIKFEDGPQSWKELRQKIGYTTWD